MTGQGFLAEALLVVASSPGTTNQGYLSEASLLVNSGTARGFLAEASLSATSGGPVINPISDTYVEPLTTVTVSASLQGGDTADSWTITQSGGPTVDLSGSGATRTFTAPPTPEGTTVLITLNATNGGLDAATVIARYFVYPQQRYRLVGTTWYAYKPLKIP